METMRAHFALIERRFDVTFLMPSSMAATASLREQNVPALRLATQTCRTLAHFHQSSIKDLLEQRRSVRGLAWCGKRPCT